MKRMAIFILLLVFIVSSSLPVFAGDLKSTQQAKSNVDSRISKLNQDKKKVLQQKAKIESDRKKVANAQADENNAYIKLTNEIKDAETNLKEIDKAVSIALDNYNQQRELVKTRLKVMYENSNSSLLQTIVESRSIIDFMEKLQYMSLIARNDSSIIDDLNQAKLDLDYKKGLQERARQLLQDKADDKQERLTSLKASRAELEDQLTKSQAELKKIEKEENSLIAESNRLNNEIKNLSRKQKYAGGVMKWPCPNNYSVVSAFGMRKHPILRKYKMHTGIDIDADTGDSIVAANKGTVIISEYNRGGYGNMIVIDHGGGITTLYGHMSKRLASVGDEVKAGEIIGKVGSTGLSTGPHLHFEVRVEGVPKNPLGKYLSN